MKVTNPFVICDLRTTSIGLQGHVHTYGITILTIFFSLVALFVIMSLHEILSDPPQKSISVELNLAIGPDFILLKKIQTK